MFLPCFFVLRVEHSPRAQAVFLNFSLSLSLSLFSQFRLKSLSRCKGLHSWKHYTKKATSNFNEWNNNFNKTKPNTSLYVMYTGMMGMGGHNFNQWYCLRISILFNNSQCSSPAPIRSAAINYHSNGNWWLFTLSPSAISGECIGLPSGLTTVTVKAENACYTPNADLRHGSKTDLTHSTTYSLRVEEYCP